MERHEIFLTQILVRADDVLLGGALRVEDSIELAVGPGRRRALLHREPGQHDLLQSRHVVFVERCVLDRIGDALEDADEVRRWRRHPASPLT